MLAHVFPLLLSRNLVAWQSSVYLIALAPLGYVKQLDNPGRVVGFRPGKGDRYSFGVQSKGSRNSGQVP
jgi:hypothetical protein